MKLIENLRRATLGAVVTITFISGCANVPKTRDAIAKSTSMPSRLADARLKPEDTITLVRSYCRQKGIDLSDVDEFRTRFQRKNGKPYWIVSLHLASARAQEIVMMGAGSLLFTVDDVSKDVSSLLTY